MKPYKSDPVNQLKSAIERLEKQQTEEISLIKEQLRDIRESLSPANLIKSAFGAASDSKPNLVATALGLVVGVLSKKLVEIGSAGPLRKILGTLLLMGIMKAANPENLKSLGRKLIHKFTNGSAKKHDEVVTYQIH